MNIQVNAKSEVREKKGNTAAAKKQKEQRSIGLSVMKGNARTKCSAKE